MPIITIQELLDAGVHFGHRTSRWNPKMERFLAGKRNSIHIIDLRETVRGLVRATHFLKSVTTQGYDVLFVGTKRGAKNVVREESARSGMPFVTERWLGGTLTNFDTIRGRLHRLEELESMEQTGEVNALSKKALARHNREKRKLLKNLDGIRHMTELPGAVVIVDPKREHIAVREANRMNIPLVAFIDSDCDPDPVDVAIPANDDAMRSVSVLLKRLSDACIDGKKSAGVRSGVSSRRSMDSSTADAIAVATGEAGRRGPSKTVVVRRAHKAPEVASAPAADTPAVETPVVETPVVDPPSAPAASEEQPAATETPAVTAETPTAETPAAPVEAPAADAPAVDTATADTGTVDTATADAIPDDKPAS